MYHEADGDISDSDFADNEPSIPYVMMQYRQHLPIIATLQVLIVNTFI